MNRLIILILSLLTISASAARDVLRLTFEVYQLPLSERTEIGDVSDPELLTALKSKSAKLIHRGALLTSAGDRCRYVDATKVSVIYNWDRNKAGKLVPEFSEELVGITAQFDTSLSADGRLLYIGYEIEHSPKPPKPLRSNFTIKDKDTVMDFDYEISAFPRIKAYGAFSATAPNGTRVIFESADEKTATLMILRFARERE